MQAVINEQTISSHSTVKKTLPLVSAGSRKISTDNTAITLQLTLCINKFEPEVISVYNNKSHVLERKSAYGKKKKNYSKKLFLWVYRKRLNVFTRLTCN